MFRKILLSALAVLGLTTVDRKYKPTFPKYLHELDGKQVSLSGFMQPLNDELEHSSFMLIEYPVGCWYCEMPEMTGIELVEAMARSGVLSTTPVVVVSSDPSETRAAETAASERCSRSSAWRRSRAARSCAC